MEKRQIDALEHRFDEISEKPDAVITKWYYTLRDEEKDYVDQAYALFLPYSRRSKADRRRRQANKEARERDSFLEELKKNLAFLKKRRGTRYREAVARAEKLLPLFKIRLPDPVGNETGREYFFGNGWNGCLEAVAQLGAIPGERKSQSAKIAFKIWDEGWNAAREALLNNEESKKIFRVR